MDVNKCKIRSKGKRTMQVTIRITKDLSEWLKDNKLSPTGIFNEAVKDLGYKNK